MRSLSTLVLVLLFLAPTAQAQTLPPEPPVRYDADVLSPEFHQDRRDQVRAVLPDTAIALFFSAPIRNRENDVYFEYRQDSDLYYLTGSTEPETVLLLAPGGIEVDGERVRELLFVPPRTAYSDTWLGRRFGPERAEAELGVEKAVSNERFSEIVLPLMHGDRHRFYHLPIRRDVDPDSELASQIESLVLNERPVRMPNSSSYARAVEAMWTVTQEQFGLVRQWAGNLQPENLLDERLADALRAFQSATSFADWQRHRRTHLDALPDPFLLRQTMDDLRVVKTDEEMALLQRAIDLTTEAHREAARVLTPGMAEFQLEATVEYIFRMGGAEQPGFPSIVGSRENAVILHYESNRRLMEAGDLVVMDIGAEYRGYSADITRTLPVSGTFTPEQRAIYELVLEAQEAGIAATRAGNDFGATNQAARAVVAAGLKRLGLIQEDREVGRFFMHGTSHYLGLWVHDAGDYGPLRAGTVITVEPGIYISPAEDIDPKWWYIGVRIEDDVLVTDGDPVVLSTNAPRTVGEIEALMREAPKWVQPQPTGIGGR